MYQFPKENDSYPDVYLAFIIKTIVDDFGSVFEKNAKSFNKEQFEAQFIENLKKLLLRRTRLKEIQEDNEGN